MEKGEFSWRGWVLLFVVNLFMAGTVLLGGCSPPTDHKSFLADEEQD
jgi:hypothetical protein